MKIAIRVDAASWIGSGHLMRCLTLAKKLRSRGAEVSFICRELPGHMGSVVEAEGFALHRLPAIEMDAPPSSEADTDGWLAVTPALDAQQSAAIITALGGVQWLIVDHYGIDQRWESAMLGVAGSIMVIDDLANRRHDCDLLLDQNLLANMEQRYHGLVPAECRCLLGPRYALLRDEFSAAIKQRRQRDGRIARIALFMGGVDLHDVTATVVRGLISLADAEISVDVVVGVNNPHREQIANLCSSDRRFSYATQVSDMATRLNQSDLVIGAAGASSWERCLLGVPALVVVLAENQRPIADSLQRRGAVIVAGDANGITAEKIAGAVAALLQQPERVRALSQAALAVMSGYSDGAAAIAALVCHGADDVKPH